MDLANALRGVGGKAENGTEGGKRRRNTGRRRNAGRVQLISTTGQIRLERIGRVPFDFLGDVMMSALHKIRSWYWTRRYREGRTITQFIACDVRRDVKVVEASQAAAGVLTVRTRTWNVLYSIKGIESQPAFGPVREVAIPNLWKWSGESWGGSVPASTDRAEFAPSVDERGDLGR